jgi:hypothetical protein
MTDHGRRATRLRAPWNKGGTYDSAFFDLHQVTVQDNISTRIFVGEIAELIHGTSGYTLVLSQRQTDGRPLWIWLRNSVRGSGSSGAMLFHQLDRKEVPQGSRIFALGRFELHDREAHSWHSLPIAHGDNIWIPPQTSEAVA